LTQTSIHEIQINYQIAALFGFWINYGTSEHISSASSTQWRIPLAVQVIPGGLLFLSMFLVWESPRWLAERGRWEDCIATLSRIRQLPPDHPYVQTEVEDMKIQLAREARINKGASFGSLILELFSKGNRNRLGFGVGMMIFQNMSGLSTLHSMILFYMLLLLYIGINAINYYSPTIVKVSCSAKLLVSLILIASSRASAYQVKTHRSLPRVYTVSSSSSSVPSFLSGYWTVLGVESHSL
jgi:hypothetical protein